MNNKFLLHIIRIPYIFKKILNRIIFLNFKFYFKLKNLKILKINYSKIKMF